LGIELETLQKVLDPNLAFPVLLIIGFIRRGVLFNYIIFEVGVLGLFWVLWLSTAAFTADQLVLLPIDCNFNYVVEGFVASCHEPQAVHAFSWLNWLILTAYWPFLLVMAIVQRSRGNPLWTKTVDEVNMFAPPVVVATQVYPPQQQTTMYASQPMQQQFQMGYPPNAPGATYPPVPTQGGGYAPNQSPQTGYAPTPPQQPYQYPPPVGGGYPRV